MVRTIRIGAALLLLLGASVAAQAAGLGKLTVTSALGQVLNAEIDLVAVQAAELDTLTARVASIEAYREARIEYSPVLRLLRFTVDKRANGQAILKVTSVGPINEPFVDVLIEITWPAGRIQREYPILLDPPGFAEARVTAQATPPPAVAKADTPPAAEPAASPSTPAAAGAEPSGTPSAKAELGGTPPAAAPSSALVSTAAGETYGPVEKGDTLNKIATQVKGASVSLEQMLVALYRENQGAFIDSNMNRLKAGQILKVPTSDEVLRIEQKEAITEYRTHVANWKQYRDQVAGSAPSIPMRTEASSAASGKVASAAVPPPTPPAAESKDVLKLSKTDSGKGGAAGKAGSAGSERAAALQEELTAKDKALKESQSRVADLEKQIKDMQRLLDLKSGMPTKGDDKKGAKDTKVAEAPKPEPAKAAPPPPPAKAEPPKPEPVKAPEPAKVEPAKPAEPAKVAEAPKPAEAKPAEPKKAAEPPKKAAPPPPPEPGIMDTLADNAVYIAAGVGGLGLLGLGGFLWSRRRKAGAEAGPNSALTSTFPSDLKPTGDTTGKPASGLVDTGNSSFLTDFDKTGPGQIDTDEVDPVAEAEVYIAYGRDSQAEEILKEAMARDKSRHEITLKLLEIYHARKSATAFENVAKELHAAVGESSPIWAKAAAMGAQIDPSNSLYGGAAAAGGEVPSATHEKPDVDLDIAGSTGAGASHASDLDMGGTPSFDLDIGGQKAVTDLSTTQAPVTGLDVPLEAPKEEKSSFDFDLSSLDMPGSAPSAPAASAPPSDLGGLSLDLDSPGGGGGGGGDGAGTKLELAKAYLEIGDKDGAKDILLEVAREGTPAQQAEAQKLIDSL